MLIDAQTLDDLEVFRAEGGHPGVFDVLDRTKTKGGRDALRRRFRAPFSDRSRVTAVQEALQFITTHREVFSLIPRDQRVTAAQRYLESNYVTLHGLNGPAAALRSVWIQFREPGLFNDALTGV